MRKIISILAVCTMVITMAGTAFASEKSLNIDDLGSMTLDDIKDMFTSSGDDTDDGSDSELSADSISMDDLLGQLDEWVDNGEEDDQNAIRLEDVVTPEILQETEDAINSILNEIATCRIRVEGNTWIYDYIYNVEIEDEGTLKSLQQAAETELKSTLENMEDTINQMKAEFEAFGMENADKASLRFIYRDSNGFAFLDKTISFRSGKVADNLSEISDDWQENMQFSVDGVVYTMPCSLSELEENGWECDSDYVVSPGSMAIGSFTLENDDYVSTESDIPCYFTIGASSLINESDEEKEASECNAQVISMKNRETAVRVYEKCPEITIAGGITWGSTAEEVEEALGEPSDVFQADGLGYSVYTYTSNIINSIKLTIDDEAGVTEIKLTHMH